jgi:hypothetical protein
MQGMTNMFEIGKFALEIILKLVSNTRSRLALAKCSSELGNCRQQIRLQWGITICAALFIIGALLVTSRYYSLAPKSFSASV